MALYVKKTIEETKAEMEEYRKYLRSMSIEEFLEYLSTDAIEKPYTKLHIAHRMNIASIYETIWVLCEMRRILLVDPRAVNTKIFASWSRERYNFPDDIMRLMRIKNVHRTIQHETMPTLCTVFQADGNNYAYLYSYSGAYVRQTNSPLEHKMCCVGKNILSADGEYRPHLLNIIHINRVRDEFIAIWGDIEEYLSDTKYTQIYYTRDAPDVAKADIGSSRFHIDFHVASWLCNPNEFMADLIKKYGDRATSAAAWMTKYGCVSSGKLSDAHHIVFIQSPELGQKIIPMSKEAERNPLNDAYPVWRELHVGRALSGLLLDGICGGFPCVFKWFPLYGININLFSSDELRDEISGSKPGRILDGDSAVVIVSEYLGKTVANSPEILKDPPAFDKYLFDTVYNLICMGRHAGIIHGDLHAGNTIVGQRLGVVPMRKTVYHIHPHVFAIDNLVKGHIIDFSRCVRIEEITPEIIQRYTGMECVADQYPAADLFVHTDKLRKFAAKFHAVPAVVERIEEAHALARHYLTTPGLPPALPAILVKMFKQYIYKGKPLDVDNVYTFDQEAKHSLHEFDRLPIYLKTRKMKKDFDEESPELYIKKLSDREPGYTTRLRSDFKQASIIERSMAKYGFEGPTISKLAPRS